MLPSSLVISSLILFMDGKHSCSLRVIIDLAVQGLYSFSVLHSRKKTWHPLTNKTVLSWHDIWNQLHCFSLNVSVTARKKWWYHTSSTVTKYGSQIIVQLMIYQGWSFCNFLLRFLQLVQVLYLSWVPWCVPVPTASFALLLLWGWHVSNLHKHCSTEIAD